MRIDVKPGKYVLAVSGGVDSMVLLHRLAKEPGVELVVAHFDHGMRSDSAKDRQLVRAVAKKYGLPFEYAEGRLGSKASEATARTARYKFLRGVMKKQGAQAIITAHHQDDLLESAIINMLRGTGRKGLVALKDQPDIKRPLLGVTKKQILDYAVQHGLKWHDDPSNQDPKYLRNYVRLEIIPRFTAVQRRQLLKSISELQILDKSIDDLVTTLQLSNRATLDRPKFINLPHAVAREVLAHWLRQNRAGELNRKMLERLVTAAKTKPAGKRLDVDKHQVIAIQKTELVLTPR